MDLSLILENAGWSLDLTQEQNLQDLAIISPELASILEKPILNLRELVLYYPLTEQQDYFDRVRYSAPSISPRQILEFITQYYNLPVSERTLRSSQRMYKASILTSPRKRDLLGEHTVLNRVVPSGDGYTLYFS